jgi:hypothetical protein
MSMLRPAALAERPIADAIAMEHLCRNSGALASAKDRKSAPCALLATAMHASEFLPF